MNRRIRVLAEAEAELQAAAEWYEMQDPEIGLGFTLLDAAAAAYRQIAEGQHGTPVPGAGTGARRVPIVRFPLWIVFVELADEVIVVAYAHERQLPGFWLKRVHHDH